MRKELKIRESRRDEFDAFVAKVNKRAAKLGIGGVTVTWGESELLPDKYRDPRGTKEIFYKVFPAVVEGEEPVIGGWSFRAAIDHLPTEENGTVNVLRVAPGYEIPTKYREAPPDCDHCGHNRSRKKTYILEHEDGRTTQVGSTCIKDFLGGDLDPELVAKFEYELFLLASDGWELDGCGGGGGDEVFKTEMVVAVAAAHVRVDGFLSKAKARDMARAGQSTADAVMGWFFFNHMKAKDWEREAYEKRTPTDRDRELARDAIEWAKALANKPDLSDYEHNLTVLVSVEVITPRHFGLLASLAPVYERFLGREIERKFRAENSKHFGEVKKREEWKMKVVRINSFEGEWGTIWIIGFLTEDGNEAVWFASNPPELVLGETYRVKGTVKKHDEYKGIPQTHLSRCKVTEIEEEAGNVGS